MEVTIFSFRDVTFIIGYMVRNHVLGLCSSAAVRLSFDCISDDFSSQMKILNTTSPNFIPDL